MTAETGCRVTTTTISEEQHRLAGAFEERHLGCVHVLFTKPESPRPLATRRLP